MKMEVKAEEEGRRKRREVRMGRGSGGEVAEGELVVSPLLSSPPLPPTPPTPGDMFIDINRVHNFDEAVSYG